VKKWECLGRKEVVRYASKCGHYNCIEYIIRSDLALRVTVIDTLAVKLGVEGDF
jgi:hypothetical protein